MSIPEGVRGIFVTFRVLANLVISSDAGKQMTLQEALRFVRWESFQLEIEFRNR